MKFTLEDLGPAAYGDLCMLARHGRDPRSGREVALVSLSRGGFIAIDPHSRTATQVRAPKPFTEWWAVAQAPDGSVYQLEYNGGAAPTVLVRWNWKGDVSEIVARVPGKSFFTIDVSPDGCVYMPEYSQNVMHRFDPAGGEVADLGDYSEFGDHIRNVVCGDDGLVYTTCTDYKTTRVAVLDPKSGRKFPLDDGDAAGSRLEYGGLTKDAAGHVLVPSDRWGRKYWHEAAGGRLRDIDQKDVMIAAGGKSLAFSDGGYISAIEEVSQVRASAPEGEIAVTYVAPDGESTRFTVPRKGVPLRIFSIASALGRIWAGTFIPLTLASFDPADGAFVHYGNPTETNGEIYSMAAAAGKLFIGSYSGAVLSRYSPDRPWRPDGPGANPAPLGVMKDDGRPLQRPYGVATDDSGNVFFSAMGGYGVEDSGISRIDSDTEQVTRWIYPDTTFTVLCYLPKADELLVAERRKGENGIRFTFVSPRTGKIVRSEIMIADEGHVTAWLYDGNDTVFGLHDNRATLFAYGLAEGKITRKLEEMNFGHHCYRSLMFGPDERIWGLTRQCVYAAERDLSRAEVVLAYEDHADGNFYRFGMCTGPDGHVYFPNGPRLMRIRVDK